MANRTDAIVPVKSRRPTVKAWHVAAAMMMGLALFVPAATAGTPMYTRKSCKRASGTVAPIQFESRRGAAEIMYIAHTRNYTIYLNSKKTDVVLQREISPRGLLPRGKIIVAEAYAQALRLRFVDANPPTEIVPVEFSGDAGASSQSMKRSYPGVVYRGIYPGTDVLFHGSEKEIALVLKFSPGADPSGIVMEVDGATKIELDADGNALLSAGEATLKLTRPASFVKRGGIQQLVSSYFVIEPHNRLRFVVDDMALKKPALID